MSGGGGHIYSTPTLVWISDSLGGRSTPNTPQLVQMNIPAAGETVLMAFWVVTRRGQGIDQQPHMYGDDQTWIRFIYTYMCM